MMDWNRKRNKRLTKTACLLLSLFLFAVPLLGGGKYGFRGQCRCLRL